jgi:tetratricopeptide (TPR) repeat protein
VHQTLKKPGGVFELLNRPDNWEAQLKVARAALDRAKALLANAEQGLGPELAATAARLEREMGQDDADRALAVRLEKIRMDRSAVVEGKLDSAGAARDYPKAFAEAGFAVLTDEPAAVAGKLAAAPIKEELVAALDDWAFVAFELGKEDLPGRLLEIGRLAAPDPGWGDRLRQVTVWRDQKALSELAKRAPDAGLSPPLLNLVGMLLVENESWYRQAAAQYPADFWLNVGLGSALQKTNLVEASGYYRVAIAVRPSSSAAYFNLGVALRDRKQLPEAIAAYHKAIDLDPKLAKAHVHLGIALFDQKQLPEAITAVRKAIDLDPKNVDAYNALGNTLRVQNKLPEAIAAFHKAIECDPNDAKVRVNLGNALHDQKKLPEAIAAYEKAIALDPNDPKAHFNLGIALFDQKRLPEAIAAYEKAIALDPKLTRAYNSLGNALRVQNKLSEAIAAYRKAIDLDPNSAKTHYNVGIVLLDQKQLPEAIAALQKAIDLDPNLPEAHGAMGLALLYQGSFNEARQSMQKSLNQFPPGYYLRNFVLSQLKRCEQLLALDERMQMVAQGKAEASAADLLAMAQMCSQYKQRHATAAELYAKAFTAQAELATDAAKSHRYSAACAAALAGGGQGDEAANLTAEQKRNFRRQAADWLQADLAVHAKLIEDGKADGVLLTVMRLAHWRTDPDLAGVREPTRLGKLSENERAAWQQLWDDVEKLQKQARAAFTETEHQGELSDKERERAHPIKMVAGKVYVIDMTSTAFDTFLRLEDPLGKRLAENDDIVPGVDLNSRLIFTAPADGVYRIVATSFEQAGTGPYTLRIREFKDGK